MKLVITDARIKTSARELWPCVEANEEGNVKIAYQTRKASKEIKNRLVDRFHMTSRRVIGSWQSLVTRFDRKITLLSLATFLFSNGYQISRAERHQPSNTKARQKKSNDTLPLETGPVARDNNTISTSKCDRQTSVAPHAIVKS